MEHIEHQHLMKRCEEHIKERSLSLGSSALAMSTVRFSNLFPLWIHHGFQRNLIEKVAKGCVIELGTQTKESLGALWAIIWFMQLFHGKV